LFALVVAVELLGMGEEEKVGKMFRFLRRKQSNKSKSTTPRD